MWHAHGLQLDNPFKEPLPRLIFLHIVCAHMTKACPQGCCSTAPMQGPLLQETAYCYTVPTKEAAGTDLASQQQAATAGLLSDRPAIHNTARTACTIQLYEKQQRTTPRHIHYCDSCRAAHAMECRAYNHQHMPAGDRLHVHVCLTFWSAAASWANPSAIPTRGFIGASVPFNAVDGALFFTCFWRAFDLVCVGWYFWLVGAVCKQVTAISNIQWLGTTP